MLPHILDRLLGHPEHLALGLRRQGAVCSRDVEPCSQSASCGRVHQLLQLNGKHLRFSTLRAKRPDGMPRIGQPMTYIVPGLVQLLQGRVFGVLAQQLRKYFQLNGDSDVALGESIMNLPRDPRSLRQYHLVPLFRIVQSLAQGQHHGRGQRYQKEQVKPDCLVIVRTQFKCERCVARVPDAVVVGRQHTKGVVTGRDVGVVSRSPHDRLDQAAIEAIELEPVMDFLRRDEAETDIIELEMTMARRHGELPPGPFNRLADIVDHKFLQGNWRRKRIHGKPCWVHLDQPLRSCEPERSIAGPPRRWVTDPSNLPTRQAVRYAELYPLRTGWCYVRAGGPGNPRAGGEP